MTAEKIYLGIDLGGTKIAVGLVTAGGQLLCSRRDWTRAAEGPVKIMEQICALVDQLLAGAAVAREQLAGIGIGVPGAIDRQRGKVLGIPNLPGWADFPVQNYLAAQYRLPVVMDNDANAAALGEYLFGAGQGCDHLIYLTVSTGIGGGIISAGRLLRGHWGVAGEAGHMVLDPEGELCNCGNRGCWETISSGTAIAREAERRLKESGKSLLTQLLSPGEAIKAEHVFQAREQGDLMAKEVIDRALYYLGLGVANLVNILSPQRVIIGGGVANAGEPLFKAVRSKVAELAFGPSGQVEIVPAQLGSQVGIIGAAALVREMG